MKKILYIVIMFLASLSAILMPFIANAQTAATLPPATAQTTRFSSDGIYGCNRTSAAASSVGAFTASGIYVPVADAATELNTGYLVYLFCTLNPLVSALSGSATAALTQKILVAFNTGNNGNPQFSVSIDPENLKVADKTFISVVPGTMNAVNPALKGPVQTAVVRTYQSATRQPSIALNCNYNGDLNGLLNGQLGASSVWVGLAALQNPACNALGAYQISNNLVNGYVGNAVENNMTELQWGQGIYPLVDANGNVVTPGAIILAQTIQAVESGFTKTQNAVAIGQMVNALFAGIGAQAVSSAQGLLGITQSIGGQPSYMSQVVAAASQGVQTAAVNAAITTLNGVLATLTAYKNSLNTIAQTLIRTIQTLQSAENQCWNNIIQNVCVAGSIQATNSSETCTQVPGPGTTIIGPNGLPTTTTSPPVTLKIATSTAFSNAVVQAGGSPTIAAQGQAIASQIQTAQNSLNAVNQLIAGVTNTTSQDAQTLALKQLDQLTASNSFPSPSVISTANQESTSITGQMQNLINQTIQNWQGIDQNGAQTLSWDGTVSATTVGWCNYNDPRTLAEWEGIWKQ